MRSIHVQMQFKRNKAGQFQLDIQLNKNLVSFIIYIATIIYLLLQKQEEPKFSNYLLGSMENSKRLKFDDMASMFEFLNEQIS